MGFAKKSLNWKATGLIWFVQKPKVGPGSDSTWVSPSEVPSMVPSLCEVLVLSWSRFGSDGEGPWD